MPKHRKCKNCGFNIIMDGGYWEHKLRSRHCNEPEPEELQIRAQEDKNDKIIMEKDKM